MARPIHHRTAIYARVSTLDQDPEAQLRELRVHARHRGLPNAAAFIDHVSGATPERPELDRLWHAGRAWKVDTIPVWKFDRSLQQIARQLGISHQTVANYAPRPPQRTRRR